MVQNEPPTTGLPSEAIATPVTGRKSKAAVFYRPEFAKVAWRLALLGALDEEIADHLGSNARTLRHWKKRHPEFRDALLAGKRKADMQVAARLFRLAMGYTSTENKVVVVKGEPVVMTYEKDVPPNVKACIFWLRNRRPDLWREKPPELEEIPSSIPEKLTPEQELTLRRIARIRAEGEREFALQQASMGEGP